jgi:hypothetical protein
MLRYIELKTGHNDDGPAWIARVKLSRSKRTVYFNGRALHQGGRGRYFDIVSHEEYWISGVKKDGTDRHWAGRGVVQIEASAVPEYLHVVGKAQLDATRLRVIPDLAETHPAQFVALENARLND